MPAVGKTIFIFGLVLAAVGILLMFGPKIPRLGRVPGDIVIKRENFTFYFPLATSILLSLALTVLYRLFGGR